MLSQTYIYRYCTIEIHNAFWRVWIFLRTCARLRFATTLEWLSRSRRGPYFENVKRVNCPREYVSLPCTHISVDAPRPWTNLPVSFLYQLGLSLVCKLVHLILRFSQKKTSVPKNVWQESLKTFEIIVSSLRALCKKSHTNSLIRSNIIIWILWESNKQYRRYHVLSW